MRNLILTVLLAFPLFALAQSAQRQVIGSAGTVSVTDDFMVSSTIGETVVATGEGDGIILTQGFQQSQDFGLSVEEPELEFSANAFPNPTMDGIVLDLNSQKAVDLTISLFDVAGKQYVVPVANLMLSGNARKEIDMSGFASGNYFIRLTDETGKLNKTIKVQKVD
ncbi:MAG TPA: T9SS type A sorting domain-containing protein [Cryomorphaceae bacterium]|nr:T9SS type A sorting domain-containing protein [Cryomorphaceae bacterium]